ncbi:unnamed protein product [Orchesella dallaii]|uniref:TAZ-type domain-containing protein n=1 Tax=Orchesella dallaii TaxID=48710 RepID=A0ABP1R2S5_9HEXA
MIPGDSAGNVSLNANVGSTAFPFHWDGFNPGNVDPDFQATMSNFLCLYRVEKWEKQRDDAEKNNLPPPAALDHQFLTNHAVLCGNDNCTVQNCQSSKLLYHHWLLCEDEDCEIVCAPVARKFLHDLINHLHNNQLQEAVNELEEYWQAMPHLSSLNRVKGILSRMWDL